MPNPISINRDVTISTFQGLNGKNQTIAMCNGTYNVTPKVSVSAGVGVETDFTDNVGAAFDVKGKYKFDDHFSVQGRVRTLVSDEKGTTQIRIAPTAQTKIAEGTTIYATPYYAYKVDFKNGGDNHSIGAFAGITQKVGKNTDISFEAQRYNLQEIRNNSADNWSVNATLTHRF